MPSCSTYHLTWVSLTLGVGYLFTAAPAKRSHCSLPWTRVISSLPLFDLQRGIAPLGPPAPVQPWLLGCGVGPPGHRPWPRRCSQRWRSSIQSAKTRPGADCGSDHEPLIVKSKHSSKKIKGYGLLKWHNCSLV